MQHVKVRWPICSLKSQGVWRGSGMDMHLGVQRYHGSRCMDVGLHIKSVRERHECVLRNAEDVKARQCRHSF